MKLLPWLLLACPAAALACGPFFYEAPPTLDRYPERLPVKTMRELLRETSPPAGPRASFAELEQETRALVSGLNAEPREVVLAKIESALERNRNGDYRKRFANCLNDLRDLLIAGAAPEAAAGRYLDSRLKWMDSDDGFIRRPKVAMEDRRSSREREQARMPDTEAASLAAGAAQASPALRPHWLVLQAARRFRQGDFVESARLFAAVAGEYPEHPRAEIAALMLARCRLELARDAAEDHEPDGVVQAQYDEADGAFAAYLEKYPRGRFAADVPGWRVDIARRFGPREALALVIRQMDVTGHPEIVRCAAREMELLLHDLEARVTDEEADTDPISDVPMDELARRPVAALAVVYHYLDAQGRKDFEDLMRHELESDQGLVGHDLVPILRLRRRGLQVLPRLAEALGRHHGELARLWLPSYLAVLAWAASEAGDHRQAVRICELAGPALATSDDLCFARAVAWQRAGDLPAARGAFEQLRADFPRSPLRVEFAFRLFTILRDLGEGGLAVAELLRMGDEHAAAEKALSDQQGEEPAAGRDLPALHLSAELDQWLDTLLQFAPLDQLERGLAAVRGQKEHEVFFRSALRWRHLAAEHFAQARSYFDETVPAQPSAPAGKEDERAPFTRAQWLETVDRLERLSREAAAAAPGLARALLEFDLAETWASARGRLTLPGEEVQTAFAGGLEPDGEHRQRNARAAGFRAEAAARELESRDELGHALPHYLLASEHAKGDPLAAQALRRANDALRLIAQRTTWAAARAFETDAATLSRQCFDRLRREFPAARGDHLWWTFPPPAEAPWTVRFSQATSYAEEVLIAESFTGRHSSEGEPDPSAKDYREWRERIAQVGAHAAEWDSARLIGELEKVREAFLPALVSPAGAAILNDLDDLELFLQESELTPMARAAYFSLRLSREAPPGEMPELRRWEDYPAFLRLVREGGPLDPETGRKGVRPIIDRMREFLQKYPHSRKREAAMARIAIAAARRAHGHAGVIDLTGDEPPALPGGQTIALNDPDPQAAPAAREALAAYAAEFPQGRYAANLLLWRGALAIDEKNWPRALHDLTAILDDPRQPDLCLDAALNLGHVFLQLLDQPAERGPLLEALRAEPAAQRRLWQFVEGKTPGARLRVMEGFLRECMQGF